MTKTSVKNADDAWNGRGYFRALGGRKLPDGVKDKEHDENKHVLGRNSWGEAWTVLTNIAVSVTNLLHQSERTKREVREKCSHNPMKTARKLGWKN